MDEKSLFDDASFELLDQKKKTINKSSKKFEVKLKDSILINNRIKDPEYWKSLKGV